MCLYPHGAVFFGHLVSLTAHTALAPWMGYACKGRLFFFVPFKSYLYLS